jgi:hypothetical protein
VSFLQKALPSLPADIQKKWFYPSSESSEDEFGISTSSLETLRHPPKLLSKDNNDPQKCLASSRFQGIIIDGKGRGSSLNYMHMSQN